LTNKKLPFIIQTMSVSTKSSNKVSLADLPDLMTIREVAELLRISPLTIKRWGKKGKLPAIRINSRGDRRYRKEVVLRLLGVEEEK
jgi:excisionase family DNA binding protein